MPSSHNPADSTSALNTKTPIRIWVDGCFDLMHFGHSNALRQAKLMGDLLVVGVHSDADILLHKGPTVMNEQERYAAAAACKWVDEVVPNAPYLTQVSWLDEYTCDFCVHGDDITTLADGTDCYKAVKDAGRYKECKRTIGVSTTDLVGRMLLLTRDHHKRRSTFDVNHFTSQLLAFSTGQPVSLYFDDKEPLVLCPGTLPNSSNKVVYVDGDFDLFHIGHIELLKRAKSMGNYLIVGIFGDECVNEIKGQNYPIMNLNERVLSVLACSYIDAVVIGVPFGITDHLLKTLTNISFVVPSQFEKECVIEGQDPYKLVKEIGLYSRVEGADDLLSTEAVMDRIIQQRQKYEERNKRKQAKEHAIVRDFGNNGHANK